MAPVLVTLRWLGLGFRGGQSFAIFFSKFGGARKRKKFREIWALLHEIFSFTSTLSRTMTFGIVLRWDGHFPTRFMCTGTSRHEIEVCATSDERTRAARAVKILQISQKFHEIWGDLAETPKRNLGDFKRNSDPPQPARSPCLCQSLPV